MKPYKNLHSYIENIRNSFNFNVCKQGQYLRRWYKTMASGVTRICTLNLFSYLSSKIPITNCLCDGLNKIIWFSIRFLVLEKDGKKKTKFTNDSTCGHYFFERKKYIKSTNQRVEDEPHVTGDIQRMPKQQTKTTLICTQNTLPLTHTQLINKI